jgi:pyruvate dehydrogenase E2 component (dihydrolipoamide acetyltransferase)
MTDFRMPSLGADMKAGTLVEWLVKPGDKVRRGDIVAIVETDKGAIEVEIFTPGVISDILVPVGTEAPVGTVLARLVGGPPAVSAVRSPSPPPAPLEPPAPLAVAAATPTAPATTAPARGAAAERPRASPAARELARQRGADLAQIVGTGPGGAITRADVDAAAAASTSRQPRARGGFDPQAMREAIAVAMSRSKREIPHYYLSQTVDLPRSLARLEVLNHDRPPSERLLPAAFFLRATALALKKSPELNGFWVEGRFHPGEAVHLGWAVALRGGGLVAPALHDADRLSLDEAMTALRDLVQRARTGGLRSSELSDPTATVTSLGDRGAEAVLPIIYPPQVAMIGIGRVVTRPWVVDGAIGQRPGAAITLAGDHRASDGHRGGLLLAEIERLLNNPEAL